MGALFGFGGRGLGEGGLDGGDDGRMEALESDGVCVGLGGCFSGEGVECQGGALTDGVGARRCEQILAEGFQGVVFFCIEVEKGENVRVAEPFCAEFEVRLEEKLRGQRAVLVEVIDEKCLAALG